MRVTSSSCAARSISNVERSRAFTPITSAPSATARWSSSALCASTSASSPSSRPYERSPAARWSSRSRRRSKTASAPASFTCSSCSSSWKNPFARSGEVVAARAAWRSASEPPKRSSTRIEIAAAPACANCAASRAGSASGRRSPADGERRLTSAIALRPGPASASRNRPITRSPRRGRTRSARRAGPRRRPSRAPRVQPPGLRAGRPHGRPRRSPPRR